MVDLTSWFSRTAYPPGDRSVEAQRRIDKARSIYDSTLRDVCILQTRAEGTSSYGYGAPTYTDSAPVACLFLPKLHDESEGAQAQRIDAEIRLPRALVVSNLARVKVTTIYGRTLTPPQVYEITAGPIAYHIGQKVEGYLVTDGSE